MFFPLLTVTDKTNPKAITWLESTLPGSTSAYNDDVEELDKLRAEVRILEEGLKCECERNSELQEQIIASRSRSDEMVAMMQLLRSETEAVLERQVAGLYVIFFAPMTLSIYLTGIFVIAPSHCRSLKGTML